MYPAVKEVIPKEDFTLALVFDNGEKGILDMTPILGFGVFERIKDYEAFKKVRVSFDTVEWECGVDLDPEYIYSNCITDKLRESILEGIRTPIEECDKELEW